MLEGKSLSAYCLVEEVLYAHKEYYLTKEEIYAHVPTDDNDVPLITISSLESALRALCHTREIECEYINGRRHFAYREARERR
jgi:hypothetical protein